MQDGLLIGYFMRFRAGMFKEGKTMISLGYIIIILVRIANKGGIISCTMS